MNNNFEFLRTYYSSDLDLELCEYRHKKTKLRLIEANVKNGEYFFSFNFKTPAINSKGMAHICEHIVLSGSEKYNIKDPFIAAVKSNSSYYLNAYTDNTYTSFPVAGSVFHDVRNAFYLYSDAVFKPLLKRQAFMTEGIRYILDKKGKIKDFDGVVYNEVSSSKYTKSDVFLEVIRKNIYKGTNFEYDFGGDRECIPLLDYEELLNFYKSHYSFDNCTLVLYGDEKKDELLDYLEKKYLEREEENYNSSVIKIDYIPNFNDIRNLKINANYFSSESKLPSYYLLFDTNINKNDTFSYRSLSILVHALLYNEKSIMRQFLLDSNIARDISEYCGIDSISSSIFFTIGLDDIKSKNKELLPNCRNLIYDVIKKIKAKKIPLSNIESAIIDTKIKNIEKSSSSPDGIRISNAVMTANDNDPFKFLDVIKDLERIEDHIKKHKSYFDDLFSSIFIKENEMLELLLTKDKCENKKAKTVKKELIDNLNRKYTKDELIKYEKQFNLYQNSSNDIDKEMFKHCSIDELLEKAEYPVVEKYDFENKNLENKFDFVYDKELRNCDEAIFIQSIVNDSKLVYVRLAFDISDIPLENLKNLEILIEAIKHSNVNDNDKFFEGFYLNLFDFDLKTSISFSKDDSSLIFLRLEFKTFKEKIDIAFDMLYELISKFVIDKSVIKKSIDILLSYFETDVEYLYPYFTSYLALDSLSSSSYYDNILEGLEFKKYLDSIKNNDCADILNNMLKLKKQIFSKNRMILYIYAPQPLTNTAVNFIKKFDNDKSKKNTILNETNKEKKNLIVYHIDGNVSYSQMSFRTQKDNPVLTMIADYMTNTNLYNYIRIKGGAYGAYALYSVNSSVFSLKSYRDPRFMETFDDFKKCLDIKFTQEDVDNSKCEYFMFLARKKSHNNLADIIFNRILSGTSNTYRKEMYDKVLNSKLSDFENCMIRLKEYSENAVCASTTPFSK